MSRTRRVMVVYPVGSSEQMPTLRGVSDYARETGCWQLQFNPELSGLNPGDLKGWPGDGVIAMLRTAAEVAAVQALRLPAVNLSGALRHSRVPRVMTDQVAMGRLAASHLMGCGLTRFAYFGEREMWYSQQRKQGFVTRLSEEGRDCRVLETTTRFGTAAPWFAWVDAVEEFLRAIEPPVGLLAVHDYAGAVVIDVCHRIGLRVPEDVAVIGIGNDWVTCEFCAVPLSSIARNNREVGYQAAALLDRLMAGKRQPPREVHIAPEGVVKRRSTDVMAMADGLVSEAVRYVQTHLNSPFGVYSLAGLLEISQRALGLRFKRALGCTPREYLARARAEQAKRLLVEHPRMKLQQIANSCGFHSLRHFHAVFRRIVGKAPDRYRRQSLENQPSPDAPKRGRASRAPR